MPGQHALYKFLILGINYCLPDCVFIYSTDDSDGEVIQYSNLAALEIRPFLPRQKNCRGDYEKLSFASALPRQFFCRGQ